MENEQILTVLAEVLEEQKEMNRTQMETLELLRTMDPESKQSTGGLSYHDTKVTTFDFKVFEQTVESLRNDIQDLVAIQRLNNQRNNLRVFMESDAKKWAVYLVVTLVFLTYLYWFSAHK